MKICIITNSSGLGGAEYALLDIVDTLIRRGAHVIVISSEQGPLLEELAIRGIACKAIRYHPWISLWFTRSKRLKMLGLNIVASVRIAWTARRFGADLIYSNLFQTITGALAASLARLPHVWHIHDFALIEPYWHFHFGKRFSMRLASFLSHDFMACSNAVAEVYRPALVNRPIEVMYNWASRAYYEEEKSPNPSTFHSSPLRCLMPCCIYSVKRQLDAVEALSLVKQAGFDATLTLVGPIGNQGYFDDLQRRIDELNLCESIDYQGEHADLLPFYRSADVVLMCCLLEGFGRVTIEAMLTGTPVIGVNSGGTAELVKDKVTGLLYPPGNIEELAQRIIWCIEHPEERWEMGRQAALSARSQCDPGQIQDQLWERLSRIARQRK